MPVLKTPPQVGRTHSHLSKTKLSATQRTTRHSVYFQNHASGVRSQKPTPQRCATSIGMATASRGDSSNQVAAPLLASRPPALQGFSSLRVRPRRTPPYLRSTFYTGSCGTTMAGERRFSDRSALLARSLRLYHQFVNFHASMTLLSFLCFMTFLKLFTAFMSIMKLLTMLLASCR